MDNSTYSAIDRLLHRMAFGGIEIQKAVADIEDQMYGTALAKVAEQPPVFITSLPRAGTTLLLDTVTALPGYASHTYRNMPFVLCPLLWRDISRSFRKPSVALPRAHGDGMNVGFDSPEAFEEVLWMAFWPRKYRGGHIDLWTANDRDPEFEDFFRRHMRKLIFAGAPEGNTGSGKAGRYLSKNNANIARLPLLRRLFPEGRIIVPFRDPLDQAASLLNQHRRFTALHAQDPFAKYYMESIGHLEFGAALKPIAFAPGFDAARADDIAFWIEYWTAAFTHVLAQAADKDVRLLDFDYLCAHPARSLEAVAAVLGDAPALPQQAFRFHAAVSHKVPAETRALPVSEKAYALYAMLQARAINRC